MTNTHMHFSLGRPIFCFYIQIKTTERIRIAALNLIVQAFTFLSRFEKTLRKAYFDDKYFAHLYFHGTEDKAEKNMEFNQKKRKLKLVLSF